MKKTKFILILTNIIFLSACNSSENKYYEKTNTFKGSYSGGPSSIDNLKSFGLTNKDLDVSALPAVTNEIIKDAFKKGYKDKEFSQYVVTSLQNEVQKMSSIDIGSPGKKLEKDGVVDPILIRAEPSEKQGFVTFYIQIPDPQKVDYGSLPVGDSPDWEDIQKNKSFNLASVTVSLTKDNTAPQIQAQGSPDFYQNSANNSNYMYYHQDPYNSFWGTYGRIAFMSSLYTPFSYWGWGYGSRYGYSYYNPMRVTTINRNYNYYNNAGASGYSYSRTPRTSSSLNLSKPYTPFTSANRVESSRMNSFKNDNLYKSRNSSYGIRRNSGFGNSYKNNSSIFNNRSNSNNYNQNRRSYGSSSDAFKNYGTRRNTGSSSYNRRSYSGSGRRTR